jgi:hypothetical protein
MKGSATAELVHDGTSSPHDATHPPWSFRSEAAIWVDDEPAGVNMLPIAAEMCKWTGQRAQSLNVAAENDLGKIGAYTNPYTYHATGIGVALADIINSAWDFSESTEAMDALDAEIARIRLNNELVLYTARFCEATIKQMLFCTQIPRRLYQRASLGGLLSMACDRCRKANRIRHEISLLGALAHQYFLCHTLERCVFTHLQFVSRRRNAESAHSESQKLNIRTAADSRAQLASSLQTIGYELGHMAQHIGEIEIRMISEIEMRLAHFPDVPAECSLMSIPARPRPP